MTDGFILCIAVGAPLFTRANADLQEGNTLTFSLLTSGTDTESFSGLTRLCSFTLELPQRRAERPDNRMEKCESVGKRSVLAELFLHAYHEFCQMDDASLRMIEQPLLQTRTNGHTESSVRPWLEQARKILHADFGDQPKLPDIAAKVGVHPVHLAREFRRQYGSSVGEYLRRLRVEFACQQLLSSDDPPVKIATAAGFVDQSHFCRTFKRFLGTTPGRYRAALKNSLQRS